MQSWRAERIGRNVDKMLRGDADASVAADQFNLDANIYGRVLTAMQQGDATMRISRVSDASARASLDRIAALFDGVNESAQAMFEGSSTLFRARQASDALLEGTAPLLQSLANIQDKISVQSATRFPNNNHIVAVAGVAVIAIFLIGFSLYRNATRRAAETAETNERNQTAILR